MNTEQGLAVASIVMSVLGPLVGVFAARTFNRRDQRRDHARQAIHDLLRELNRWQRFLLENGEAIGSSQSEELRRQVWNYYDELEYRSFIADLALGRLGDRLRAEVWKLMEFAELCELRKQIGATEFRRLISDLRSGINRELAKILARIFGDDYEQELMW